MIESKIRSLANLYVGDTQPGYVQSALDRIARKHPGTVIGLLALHLTLASDTYVDGLLCDIDKYDRASSSPNNADHLWCCDQGEGCGCRGRDDCARCTDVLIDRMDQAVNDLLAVLHPRIREHLNYLSREALVA